MTIILFLVDTSASMCQRAYVNGVQKTYLDIAKGAVETFLKYRQRSQDCMGDRYMLLTFEDPPCNVKAGWKENHTTFTNELKNLQSSGLTAMNDGLKNAFDLLNLNRMQSGIDTYGQGRCPFYLEPSVIIVITEGGKYSFRNGIHPDITLPLHAQIPGAKLTKEPFRWDQRLFSLVLRMAGNKIDERVEGKVPHDESPIEKMCEVTGGRSYRVKSHFVLNQCIESLVQKVQPGVIVQFDQLMTKDLKDGDIQDIVFQPMKKMIYVPKHPSQKNFNNGSWPIPEPYWPDPKTTNLPSRDAHPKLRVVTPCCDEPTIVRNFPIDKYEVEASPLTLQILSKREMNKCWPVLVSHGLHTLEVPFGYLKANATFTQVHLMVMPYNYPALFPMLNDLFTKHALNPNPDWMYKFNAYVRTIPQYYVPFLRRNLQIANVPYPLVQYILPESLDSYLTAGVANYLKQMKNTAKQDQENSCLRVFKQLKTPKQPFHQVETAKLNCGLVLKRDLVTHPQLKDTFGQMHKEITTYENYAIVVPTVTHQSSAKNYRNPFDIPRRDLIDEIARMRENFFRSSTAGINLYTKDAGHCLPISEMGNYQEYLKNKEIPLREIEPTNVRQHMFGNPYKKDKHMVMVDEADLGEVPPMKPNAAASPKKLENTSRLRKRKAGPIKKDFVYKRKSIDVNDIYSSSSSQSGFSDSEDETASDISSLSSCDESTEDRLTIDFDFNEPSSVDDFPINGHVQDFINGDIEDPDDNSIPISSSLLSSPSIQISMSSPVASPLIPPPLLTSALASALPATTTAGVATLTTKQSSSTPTQPPTNGTNPITPTSVVTPPVQQQPPSIPLAGIGVSDMNDVSQISKILQQCHNGLDQQLQRHDHHHHHPQPQHQQQQQQQPQHQTPQLLPPLQHRHHRNSSEKITETMRMEIDEDIKQQVVNDVAAAAAATIINNDVIVKQQRDIVIVEDEDTRQRKEEHIKQANSEARSIIFRDIRRPGRNYELLLEHLEMVEGNFDTKFNFIKMCVTESLRFRRKRMAESIQEWWEKRIDENGSST